MGLLNAIQWTMYISNWTTKLRLIPIFVVKEDAFEFGVIIFTIKNSLILSQTSKLSL